MASFSFDEVDFSAYNVTLLKTNKDDLERSFKYDQLQERVYGWRSQLTAKRLILEVLISADTGELDIHSLLSQCRGLLNQSDDCKLQLSSLVDKYWWARFRLIDGALISPKHWRGEIQFTLSDPRAFALVETQSNYNIDANPKTVIETTVGTAYVEPIYLLTAGETLSSATITLESLLTGEKIEWQGDLVSTDELTIDVEHWLVKKNAVVDMGDVSGEFPILKSGANSIKVTGFGTLGTLDITYRDAYI